AAHAWPWSPRGNRRLSTGGAFGFRLRRGVSEDPVEPWRNPSRHAHSPRHDAHRSLTTSELTEAAIENEHAVAADKVEDASGLAEAVDEYGGEAVRPETSGEDADELAGGA